MPTKYVMQITESFKTAYDFFDLITDLNQVM